jgi:integrative and conjugative element protein (TIGR02256 family)
MAEPIAYAIPQGFGRLILAPAVVEHILAHRQLRWWSREAGGQLFADLSTPSEVRVVEATGPRRSDQRSVYGYKPNRRAETREIEERYRAGLHFVGDWHTHRQREPEPSPPDLESIRKVVAQSKHSFPGFFLIIAGQHSDPKTFHVSFHTPSTDYLLTPTPPMGGTSEGYDHNG